MANVGKYNLPHPNLQGEHVKVCIMKSTRYGSNLE